MNTVESMEGKKPTLHAALRIKEDIKQRKKALERGP
jgi:hypothetical protein